MKRRKIINIRKGVATLALVVTAVVASLTNSSALESEDTVISNNIDPETSQTIITDSKQQILAGGLIVDPLDIHPVGVVEQDEKLDWVSVNAVFEEAYDEEGNVIGRRNHDYKITNVEVEANDNKTHTKHITAECKSCGYIWHTDRTESCYYEKEGTIKGNKIVYECKTEGCTNSYSKPYTPNYNHGGGSHGGSNGGNHGGNTGEDKPEHTHNWSSWTAISDTEHARTCTADGCSIKTETAKHGFGEWSEWSEWDLTTDADGKQIEYRTRTQTCSDCGYVKSEKQTRPYNPGHTTHDYSVIVSTKFVSDQVNNQHYTEVTKKCSGCSSTKVEKENVTNCSYTIEGTATYAATDETHHKYTKIDNCSDPRCTNTLKTEKELECNFTWTHDADGGIENCDLCTNTRNEHTHDHGVDTDICRTIYEDCSKCPEKDIEINLAHNYVEFSIKDYPALGYKEIIEKCTRCNKYNITKEYYTPSEDCEHTYNWVIVGDKAEYKCNKCGKVQDSHTHDTGVTSNICGSTSTTCPNCKATYEVNYGHNYEWEHNTDHGVERCTNNNCSSTRNEHTHDHGVDTDICRTIYEDCGKCPEKDIEVNLAHNYVEFSVKDYPALGYKEIIEKCTRCNKYNTTKEYYSKSSEIEQNTMNYSETNVAQNSTYNSNPEEIIIPITPSENEIENDVTEIIESGKAEADKVIEAGKQEVEQIIEKGNDEVQAILEKADAELQERLAASDASIASLFASNPLKRIRRLF